jgi:hypothetical protein
MASLRRTSGCVVLSFGLMAIWAPALVAEATHRHYGTPVVDGVQGEGEWEEGFVGLFPMKLPKRLGGSPSMVPLYVMNDDEFHYLAARIDYGKSPSDPYFLFLDTEVWPTDFSCEPFVERFAVFSREEVAIAPDQFLLACDNLLFDSQGGGTNETVGTWRISDRMTFFEVGHPLDSDDDLYDMSFPPPRLVVLNFTAGGGSFELFDYGQLAAGILKVFLLSSDTLLYADFEVGDLDGWTSAEP